MNKNALFFGSIFKGGFTNRCCDNDFLNIAIQDSDTIDFDGNGTVQNPLTGSVIISEEPDNTLEVLEDGLYVPPTAGSAVNVEDSGTIDFDGDGSVGDPLTGSVIISPAGDNILVDNGDGLYVPNPASSIAAQNGITNDGGTLELGGNLVESTFISLDGNTLIFQDGTGGDIEIASPAINFYNTSVLIGSISSDEDELLITGNSRTTGWVLGQIKIDVQDGATGAQAEESGILFMNVDDGFFLGRQVTLPVAVPGLTYHFAYSGNGVEFLQIIAQAGEFIYYGGHAGLNPTVAGAIEANNEGCTITLVCTKPGIWYSLSQVGIWATV